MAETIKKGTELATIDVAMVTVSTYAEPEKVLALTTANQIQVTVGTETTDKIALIVKGVLIAQKPQETTVTGNTIVLTDNVFIPELVKILQGGTIEYDEDGTTFKKYTPPVAGSSEKGEPFLLKAYSAIYGADALIKGYECITYPNCQGVPVAFNSQDGTFRAPEYTINSAPSNGEAPYELERVDALPVVTNTASTASTTTP